MIWGSRRTARLTTILAALGGTVLQGCGGAAADADGATRETVRAFTGARTRVVWLQDQKDGRDAFAKGNDLLVMAFGTDDEHGPRSLVAAADNFRKPLVSPGGDRVVYTNRREGRVYVVSWDGGGMRVLCDGSAIEVWRDPADGVDWVYVADEDLTNDREPYGNLRRIRLDGRGKPEPVWNRTQVSANSLQISRDGARAAGLFPWPEAGVLDLVERSWRRYGKGCWTSMAPDDSYVFWIFDGAHRNLAMHSPSDGMRWTVPIDRAPGVDGYEVYHPRWSNHARFMVMTGPYKIGGGDNRIRGGGTGVEIHLGRFSDDLGRIESWCRVTDNGKGDFQPDVWIETGDASDLAAELATRRARVLSGLSEAGPAVALGEEWPGTHKDLVFVWENEGAQNEIREPETDRVIDCRVEAQGHARFGRRHELRPAGGAFRALDADKRLLDACRGGNELTVEAVLSTDVLEQGGPARIVSFSDGTRSRNFTLGQQGQKLVFRLRTPRTGPNGDRPAVEFGMLQPGATRHILVTYRPGTLACYVDGEPAALSELVQGGFGNWEPQQLIFGNETTGDRPWRGGLEGVAIFGRFIGPEEARHHYDLYAAKLADREAAPRFRVRGKLVGKSATPSPESIAPYRRALSVYTYEAVGGAEPVTAPEETGIVTNSAPGDVPEDSGILTNSAPGRGERILVAHWVVLDAEIVPFDRRVGEEYDLWIEPFDDHPQLEGERLIMDTDEFELEMYVDVAE